MLYQLSRLEEARAAYEWYLRIIPNDVATREMVREIQIPNSPFNKLTVGVHKALSLSSEEARCWQTPSIETEHLLLGLISEEEGVAVKVLSSLNVELRLLRGMLEGRMVRGDRPVALDEPSLSPRVKRVIELAVDEARLQSRHYVGTEHLLLGLIREGEGLAASILESLGVKLEKARTQTIEMFRMHVLIHNQAGALPEMASVTLKEALTALERVLREKESAAEHAQDELRSHEVKLREHIANLVEICGPSFGTSDQLTDWMHGVLNFSMEKIQRFPELAFTNLRETSAVLTWVGREKEAAIQQSRYELADELHSYEMKLREHDARMRLDRFTEQARNVLSFAGEEARRLQHNSIGTEHLLLGLLREGKGIAAQVLASFGVGLLKLRTAIVFVIDRKDPPSESVGLRIQAQKVIERAVEEAGRLNHDSIGTEHLLLGLVDEGNCLAIAILESLGVNGEQLRTRTLQMLFGESHARTLQMLSNDPHIVSLIRGEQFETPSRILWNPTLGSQFSIPLTQNTRWPQKSDPEALAAYEQALRLNPNDPLNCYSKGVAFNDLKRREEALAAYEQAVRLHPNFVLAWYDKGVVLNALKRHEEALAAYEQALRLNPNFALAWHDKGVVLNALKRHEEALAAYEQALRLNPSYINAWCNKGITLNSLKRYEEALIAYERALRLDLNCACAWNNRGAALNNLGRYEEGLVASERALRLDPNDANAWDIKGFALNRLKRYEEALTAYEQALRLDSNHAFASSGKEEVLRKLNRPPATTSHILPLSGKDEPLDQERKAISWWSRLFRPK